jgi:hypothetical protein
MCPAAGSTVLPFRVPQWFTEPVAEFHEAFWVTTATVAPVLLVAYAQTFIELFTRHRETAGCRPRLDRLWAGLWINAVPLLGGIVTLGSVIVVAVGRDTAVERMIAIALLAALLVGLLFSGFTLISLGRRFPKGESQTWKSEPPIGLPRTRWRRRS